MVRRFILNSKNQNGEMQIDPGKSYQLLIELNDYNKNSSFIEVYLTGIKNKLEYQKNRQKLIQNSNLYEIDKIYWLIEDAKRYGSLPFAGLARAAFMATQLVKSLVAIGIFSEDDYDSFMLSVQTISSELSHDKYELSKESFIKKYGSKA